MDQRESAVRNLLPGLILIALGALFLADKFFSVNFAWYYRTWWPTLLIAFGLLRLIERPHRPVGALILIGLGVMFQVDRLDVLSWWRMHRMWPVILIVIGVALLISRLQPRPGLPANHS
jgi:uncharacterized membrane protein